MSRKTDFEDALSALLAANPRDNSKGRKLVSWVQDEFGLSCRCSHITEDKQIGNRIAEQFRHAPTVVVFLVEPSVSIDTLVKRSKEDAGSGLQTILIVRNGSPFIYKRLLVKTSNSFSEWAQSEFMIPPEEILPVVEPPASTISTNPVSTGESPQIVDSVSAEDYPLQRIFYGAPGTGKSYQTNEIVTAFSDTIRTTFHPDSDYASFVGCYKPSMKKRPRTTFLVSGTGFKVEKGPADPAEEEFIAYEFVPQAFTKAYQLAWQKMAECKEGEHPAPQFLVIEEINRGNCAQVFGDLFQLLDRDDAGYSKYPVDPDTDLAKHLHGWFRGEFKDGTGKPSPKIVANEADEEKWKAMTAGTVDPMKSGERTTWDDVLAGRKLVLPPNLFIWATMNTSDQSLFPMDSAFKRRWDWKYVPIRKPEKKEDGTSWVDWTIRIPASEDGKKPAAEYAWWDFLETINERIGEATSSEDKKLGYFFVKADSTGEIPLEAFVNKVVFYLWNDAFRAVGTEELGFEVEVVKKKKDGSEEKKKRSAQFEDFFGSDGKPDPERIREFLTKLEIQPKKETAAPPPSAPAAPVAPGTP